MIESAKIINENGAVEINGKYILTDQKNHMGSAYHKWLSEGNEPTPYDNTQDKAKECKAWRDGELTSFVDYYQSKPLLFSELSESKQTAIANYRITLKEYPNLPGFPDIDRPIRPVI